MIVERYLSPRRAKACPESQANARSGRYADWRLCRLGDDLRTTDVAHFVSFRLSLSLTRVSKSHKLLVFSKMVGQHSWTFRSFHRRGCFRQPRVSGDRKGSLVRRRSLSPCCRQHTLPVLVRDSQGFCVYRSVIALLKRVFIASYSPDAQTEAFLQRAQKQQNAFADVMAAVPDSKESSQIFGVSLTRRGIQPLYLRITNRSNVPLRLKFPP